MLLCFQCGYALLQFVHRAAGVVQRSLQAVAFCAQCLALHQLLLTLAERGTGVFQFTVQLRALGAQLKWEHMRYGPVDPGIWAHLALVYKRLDAAGIARTAVRDFPGAATKTTAEQEFVRIAMLAR